MTDASPAILSIAVIASLALIGGGLRLIRRPADRMRGVLMLLAAAVILGNVLIWALPTRAEVASVRQAE